MAHETANARLLGRTHRLRLHAHSRGVRELTGRVCSKIARGIRHERFAAVSCVDGVAARTSTGSSFGRRASRGDEQGHAKCKRPVHELLRPKKEACELEGWRAFQIFWVHAVCRGAWFGRSVRRSLVRRSPLPVIQSRATMVAAWAGAAASTADSTAPDVLFTDLFFPSA
eukprot:366167-Chlamydomonas_euryale.AAC.18